ncbi:uncharacterized protein TEOVI_000412800 [Trypanosoma equiperdum]|uniref:Uncharacterized protein n=2 Tax=Trypanozoon TaxID=39700 RepID=Q38BX1_TRYB2|nr:hypothetical protein, unlikely [Trypanosoma brucei brucei TREU927]EAN77699.1 hypothetical protein, unlikely [Trypanosoma brucei brucei TREU927]SCU72551.1 hypothetical protein, conserved [Trypanosoma equiperdum]
MRRPMGNEKADNMNMEGNRGMDYTDITGERKEVVKVFWRIRGDWREWETDKSRSGEEFEVRSQVPSGRTFGGLMFFFRWARSALSCSFPVRSVLKRWRLWYVIDKLERWENK